MSVCICESRDNFVICGVLDSRRIHKKRNAQTESNIRRHTQPYMRAAEEEVRLKKSMLAGASEKRTA